jgi:predicted ABC-type ATPase
MMVSTPTRHAVVVGGPNGAGKTSWAVRNLPTILGIREFVNADEIAHGLSPLDPDAAALTAGRLMLERLDALVAARKALRSKRRVPVAVTVVC